MAATTTTAIQGTHTHTTPTKFCCCFDIDFMKRFLSWPRTLVAIKVREKKKSQYIVKQQYRIIKIHEKKNPVLWEEKNGVNWCKMEFSGGGQTAAWSWLSMGGRDVIRNVREMWWWIGMTTLGGVLKAIAHFWSFMIKASQSSKDQVNKIQYIHLISRFN